jgi:hypothetical protein
MFDFDNLLILIVDGSEVLYIPPMPDESLYAMASKNKAYVNMMMLMMPAFIQKELPAEK